MRALRRVAPFSVPAFSARIAFDSPFRAVAPTTPFCSTSVSTTVDLGARSLADTLASSRGSGAAPAAEEGTHSRCTSRAATAAAVAAPSSARAAAATSASRLRRKRTCHGDSSSPVTRRAGGCFASCVRSPVSKALSPSAANCSASTSNVLTSRGEAPGTAGSLCVSRSDLSVSLCLSLVTVSVMMRPPRGELPPDQPPTAPKTAVRSHKAVHVGAAEKDPMAMAKCRTTQAGARVLRRGRQRLCLGPRRHHSLYRSTPGIALRNARRRHCDCRKMHLPLIRT